MKARAIEFREQICSVTTPEWDTHTDSEWVDWFKAWNTYVELGGQRPHNRPPI